MIKYIISHKNPDTDTICSSIIYSKFLEKKKIKTIVCKLGKLNNETKFVLEKFGFEEPKTIDKLDENSNIILMDHNEAKQSIDNRDRYKIYQVIDHHKIDFQTSEPLNIRCEPIGSTCSIIAKMFFEQKINLTKNEAGMLLSGIISDTLYFRSPTTTKEDIVLRDKLNEIAKIENLKEYAYKLFDKKSDLGNIKIRDLIKLDYKEFNIKKKKIGIGVMETTSPKFGLNKKKEIIEDLKKIKLEDNLDYVFFSIIDILNEENITIYENENMGKMLSLAFDVNCCDNECHIGRILSRKKQIVPKLENLKNII